MDIKLILSAALRAYCNERWSVCTDEVTRLRRLHEKDKDKIPSETVIWQYQIAASTYSEIIEWINKNEVVLENRIDT